MIPGLTVYLVIVAYPILYSLWLSLTDFNPNRGGSWSFVGLLQYRTMLRDPDFWHALKNNLVVVAVSVFGQIPIGFALAYILFRKLVRAGRFYQSMVFFPNFLSTIVIGTLWKRLFQADGPVARLLQLLSGNPLRAVRPDAASRNSHVPHRLRPDLDVHRPVHGRLPGQHAEARRST